jgi:hypothetical protein
MATHRYPSSLRLLLSYVTSTEGVDPEKGRSGMAFLQTKAFAILFLLLYCMPEGILMGGYMVWAFRLEYFNTTCFWLSGV